MSLHHYEQNEVTTLLSGILYVYNGSGSLVSDAGRGIARIDYDRLNNPVRIQFTDGSVTRYVYSTAGEKLRVIHQTAVPNITVAIGSARELLPSEILSADSTDYLLGGSLTLRNGRIDKLQFEEGYCQAAAYSGNASQDNFTFHYYDRDHLGNIRQVINAIGSTKGTVIQRMDYYPFGAQFCDGSADNEVQSRKYNGKELDKMHGLNTYDYGARQYNPVTARWDRADPLCEKYYAISPYTYCGGNPIRFIDPDGKKVIPVYYKDNKKPVYYHSPDKFKKAMHAFAKTSFGKQILSDFTPNGSWIFGVKGNGKYAQFDLMIYEYEFTDIQAHTTFWFDRNDNKTIISQTQLKKDETGKPKFSILFDINYSENELTESITHEFTVHMTDYKSVLDSYIKSSNYSEAEMQWNKFSQDYEHFDLIHNKQLESSKNFYKTKNELISKNPALNQVFTNRLKEYE